MRYIRAPGGPNGSARNRCAVSPGRPGSPGPPGAGEYSSPARRPAPAAAPPSSTYARRLRPAAGRSPAVGHVQPGSRRRPRCTRSGRRSCSRQPGGRAQLAPQGRAERLAAEHQHAAAGAAGPSSRPAGSSCWSVRGCQVEEVDPLARRRSRPGRPGRAGSRRRSRAARARRPAAAGPPTTCRTRTPPSARPAATLPAAAASGHQRGHVVGEQVGQLPVLDHHALGPAGGAGGVDDVRACSVRRAAAPTPVRRR